LEEAEEASSQASSTDSGLSELSQSFLATTDDRGVATGRKRTRLAAPARVLPARQRRKPARYQAA